jgi:hypothetical protein
MVRAEDGTEFSSLSQAEATECRACGKRLHFKKADQEETPGIVATATHCDTLYTIGSPSHYTISAALITDEKEKEKAQKEQEKENEPAVEAAPTATTTSTSGSGTSKGKK